MPFILLEGFHAIGCFCRTQMQLNNSVEAMIPD